jgi:hypothetical protein
MENGGSIPHPNGVEDAASNTIEAIAQAQAISAGKIYTIFNLNSAYISQTRLPSTIVRSGFGESKRKKSELYFHHSLFTPVRNLYLFIRDVLSKSTLKMQRILAVSIQDLAKNSLQCGSDLLFYSRLALSHFPTTWHKRTFILG